MARLNPNKLQLTEYATRMFTAEPEFGETLADVMDPAYWVHCIVKGLQVGTEITVKPVGLPWYAKLMVVEVGESRATVKLLEFADLTTEHALPKMPVLVTEKALGKFKVERAGAWCRVVRVEDGAVMKTGMRTMDQAETWARENLSVAA